MAAYLRRERGTTGTGTKASHSEALHVAGISERGKEIKRRRQRRKKLAHLAQRLKKATVSEKTVIAAKIRMLESDR